jgi:hypothetical protein
MDGMEMLGFWLLAFGLLGFGPVLLLEGRRCASQRSPDKAMLGL